MNEEINFPVELNLFVRTPEGFDGHVKVTEVPSMRLVAAMATVSKKLAEAGFVASPKYGITAAPANKPQQQQRARPNARPRQQPVDDFDDDSFPPNCDYCGGDVWDNRKNKRTPKAPDFRCKDKDNCGAAGWLQSDGDVKWAPPQQG